MVTVLHGELLEAEFQLLIKDTVLFGSFWAVKKQRGFISSALVVVMFESLCSAPDQEPGR